METVSVLIVEDNPQCAESIASYLQMRGNIETIGIAGNAFEAMDVLKTHMPDVILLDLVMPQADGFLLLQHLKELRLSQTPKVIVISALSNDTITKQASLGGALYFMVKPFSMSVLYERIMELTQAERTEPVAQQETGANANANAIALRGTLDEQLAKLFLSIGIPSHLKGYRYLLEAVKILIDRPEMIENISKKLFPDIAKVFDTTVVNIERAIRLVIEATCKSNKLEKINAFLGVDVYHAGDKLTSAEFLSIFSNEVFAQKLRA